MWTENFDTGSFDPAWSTSNPSARPSKFRVAQYATNRVTTESHYYDGWDIFDTNRMETVVVESQSAANEAAAGFTLENFSFPHDGTWYSGWYSGASNVVADVIFLPIKKTNTFYRYTVSSLTSIKYSLYRNNSLVITNDLSFSTQNNGYVIEDSMYFGCTFNTLLATDVFKIKFWFLNGSTAATYLSKLFILGIQLDPSGSYGSTDHWVDIPGSITVDNTRAQSGSYSAKVVGHKQSYDGATLQYYRSIPNSNSLTGDFYYKQNVYLPEPTIENFDPSGWRPGLTFPTYSSPYLYAKRNVNYGFALRSVSGGGTRTNSSSTLILKAEPDSTTRFGGYLNCTSDYANSAAMAAAQGTNWDFMFEYNKLSLAPTATTYDVKVMVKATAGQAFKLSARDAWFGAGTYGSIVTVDYTGTGAWETVTIPGVTFNLGARNFSHTSTQVQFCAWQVSGTLNAISIDEMWVESPYTFSDGWWWGKKDTSNTFHGVSILPNRWQCLTHRHNRSLQNMTLSTRTETTGSFSVDNYTEATLRIIGDFSCGPYWIDSISAGATDEVLVCAQGIAGMTWKAGDQ